MNERYHWYKGHGICPYCGVEDGFKGGTMCEKCKAYRKKYKRFKRKYFKARVEVIALEYELKTLKEKKAGGDDAKLSVLQ